MRPIAQLVSTLERQGLRIWLSGGEVKFEGPESALVGPAFTIAGA